MSSRRRLPTISCRLVLTLTCVFAAPSSAEPDALTAKVDRLLSGWDRDDAPGCAIGVLRDGEFVYRRGFGLADLENKVPITPGTAFYIASTSKQFTAACVMHLAATGKISLDDDVRKHVPELPDYGTPVTIRQMIHHRSGLLDFYETTAIAGLPLDSLSSNASAAALVAKVDGLCFEPGSRFLYSNTGYLLLAEIIRRVTGKTLGAYAQETVFATLGMKRSVFRESLDQPIEDKALGYEASGNGWKRSALDLPLYGPGGLFSTLDDLARWDRNFTEAKWGGKDLLGKLQTPPLLQPGQTRHPRLGRYAAGLMLGAHRGLRTVSHFGGAFGYGAELLRFPDQRLSVICLSNTQRFDPKGTAIRIAEIFLEDEMGKAEKQAAKREPAVAWTDELRQSGGIYRNPESGEVWVMNITASGASAIALGPTRLTLEPVGERRLRAEAVFPFHFTFRPDSEGAVTLIVEQENAPPAPFRKLAPVSLTGEELKAYAGNYRNASLDSTHRLRARGGRLTLGVTNPILPIAPFTPASPDTFLSNTGVQIDFERNPEGKITGYSISVGRAWGLRYERVDE